MADEISRDRAERIARAQACDRCGEYSFKRLLVRPASKANRDALKEIWHVSRVCGVCGRNEELGLDAEGEIVYVG